jgi:hypothetical protein
MNTLRRTASEVPLWTLFFSIAAGLGYPTLNRYDPRKQLPDAFVYSQLAVSGPSQIHDHFRFRILVPWLARCVDTVAQGHTGSWDPLMFSFLLVNAAFVATTAYLLYGCGITLLSRSVALLGATLYLLNFAIANLQLAALVDAAEACALMALIAAMFYERWFLLPVIGAVGTLAKESFVPFSIIMTITWWSTARRSRAKVVWIVALVIVDLLTMIRLQSSILGHMVSPWSFLANMSSETNYGTNLLHSLVDRTSWYILIWLLPLGLAGIKQFPRPWKAAVGVGALTALLLNAYHSTVGGGGGGTGRYIFNVAGPLLSLSAASFLSKPNLGQSPALD